MYLHSLWYEKESDKAAAAAHLKEVTELTKLREYLVGRLDSLRNTRLSSKIDSGWVYEEAARLGAEKELTALIKILTF